MIVPPNFIFVEFWFLNLQRTQLTQVVGVERPLRHYSLNLSTNDTNSLSSHRNFFVRSHQSQTGLLAVWKVSREMSVQDATCFATCNAIILIIRFKLRKNFSNISRSSDHAVWKSWEGMIIRRFFNHIYTRL